MKTITPLQPGHYYHIYNRGNNRENLFHSERNYRYFLQLYAHHIYSIADTFAYCLLKNHFHLFVRIKETSQVSKTCEVFTSKEISQRFSNLFNAYAKAINKAYGRTGSLFEERFGRIEVNSTHYFLQLIVYIHFNPQKHGFIDNFCEWPWSSYHTLRTLKDTKLNRSDVLTWFGDKTRFDEFHRGMVDEKVVAKLIDTDLQ